MITLTFVALLNSNGNSNNGTTGNSTMVELANEQVFQLAAEGNDTMSANGNSTAPPTEAELLDDILALRSTIVETYNDAQSDAGVPLVDDDVGFLYEPSEGSVTYSVVVPDTDDAENGRAAVEALLASDAGALCSNELCVDSVDSEVFVPPTTTSTAAPTTSSSGGGPTTAPSPGGPADAVEDDGGLDE